MLVDTHCHLGDPGFDGDRPEVLARARAAGVEHVVVVAESAEATDRAIVLGREPGLSATAGVHPHSASSWTPDVARRISEALANPAVVAVGETGLDYHYDHSPRAAQRAAFTAQLELAADHAKPVVVHAREADDDMAAIILDWGRRVPALVLHSFSSGSKVWDAGMAVGAYFSFSGMVTFRNFRLLDCLTGCPPDRLLVETDAPYLAPVPHRGKRNEPAYVPHIAARIAECRGETPDAIANRTTANAERCFGPRVTHSTLLSSP